MLVLQRSQGLWSLILDNFGGHNIRLNFSNPRIEFLTPKCTVVDHPLDMDIIDVTKRRCMFFLLKIIINDTLLRNKEDNGFRNISGQGPHGLDQEQLHHLAEAVKNFNQAWNSIEQIPI